MALSKQVKEYGKRFSKQYKAAFKTIKAYDKIVVFRHLKPDFDAMGTQMGMVQFLKDNFPEKEVHFVGDDHVSFTPRLFPETEKLSEEWFNENKFLAIVVDVGDTSRIADPRFEKASAIIKFDHHPCKAEIAAPELTICDIDAAAASEVVVDALLHFKGMRISKEAARHFYIALVGDSGRFMFSSTSPHTFAIAQALLATGIDISAIYLTMYEKTINSLQNQAYVLSHFHVSPHGVAYYLLPKEVQEELHITPELGKENVNLFSNIKGINAWCSITEDPNPKDYCWRVSIRSKRKDISGVANKWEGGGHAQASGAKIVDIADLDKFIADLDALFVEDN